jgi:predicted amidohydrolase YtcJ
MLLTDPEDITNIGKKALQYNWQVCTHAIGDSANRKILQIYASLLKTKNDKRWRIEHAQLVHPADFHFFGLYNIIPSVQPTHAISDMPWVAERIGMDRMPEAYAYKQLLDENDWIALGTDFPVEAINPIATFYTAVFRKDKAGNPGDGFLPANALSREEALKGMTIWAAKSIFREKEKGSLEAGKDADIVVYDCDLMQDLPEKIINAKPVYTIVKGKIVYRAE